MTPSKSHDELKGQLHDAVITVRETSIDEALIERCRQSAVGLAPALDNPKSCAGYGFSIWRVPMTLAASLLLLINVVQAYSRLPSSSRELVAIHQSARMGRLYVYSDLSIDLAPSYLEEQIRSKP
jgi:hypothetical protein